MFDLYIVEVYKSRSSADPSNDMMALNEKSVEAAIDQPPRRSRASIGH